MPKVREQKVNYNTQVFLSTDNLVRNFLESHPDMSKAALTDAALREYMENHSPDGQKEN